MSNNVLVVKNIRKSFEDAQKNITIWKDLSFSVPQGAQIAIVGRSGSGKTTLLNCLGLLENPDQGDIILQGQATRHLSESAKTQLRNRLHHSPAKHTGGERQRVAISRALIMKPKLLFADEPTGNLDFETAESVMQQLREVVRAEQAAFLLVTHDKTLAESMDAKIFLDAHI